MNARLSLFDDIARMPSFSDTPREVHPCSFVPPARLECCCASSAAGGGLTQAQLARRAEVSRQWLSGVERGREGAELGRVLRTLACAGVILKFEELQPSPLDPTAVVEAHRSPVPE